MQNESIVYDVAGIGIGPFNLGLAALATPLKTLQTIFFDARPRFTWHEGLMLDFSKMQVPFLADLVTGADPTNPYSYLAFLKQTGQLFQFAILEDSYILRKEYDTYCNWVAKQLPNLRFSHTVVGVQWDDVRQLYLIHVLHEEKIHVWLAKRIVIGIGSEPYIPTDIPVQTDTFFHASRYLSLKARLVKQSKVTIIGSGQSAAEIFYDLLLEKGSAIRQLHWFTRSARFHPMETSKMTLEMTSPDYIRYFYSLSQDQKETTLSGQQYLYKGINQELLAAIYEALHRHKPTSLQCALVPNSELTKVDESTGGKYHLHFHHFEKDKDFEIETDVVVLATGYQAHIPAFLDGIKDRLLFDDKGRYGVNLHYAVDITGSGVFIQNAETHTHGFNTPDLGMGPHRNSIILNTILGYEHYLVEKDIAFQIFDPFHFFSSTI